MLVQEDTYKRFILKVFLQIIAWLGVLIIALAVSIAYGAGGFNVDMYGMGLGVAAIICLVGVLLLLLGGFIKISAEYPLACWRDESGLTRKLVGWLLFP